MAEWILDKKDLESVLQAWSQSREVLVPVSDGRVSRFKPYQPGTSIDLGKSDTRIPPKEVFLPNGEVLFEYNGEGKVIPRDNAAPARVLVGVRPCDAMAATITDTVFYDSHFRDDLYISKRNACVMVGIACNEPRSTCFCTSVGGDPFGEKGLDAILVDLGDSYYLKTLSPRGEELVAQAGGFFREYKGEDSSRVAGIAEKARSSMKPVPVAAAQERLKTMFNDSYWSTLHETCIGCGVCTYVCPTCYCFDITDEGYPAGCRVRTWDSCQFPLFTLHTSGHNPRPSGLERWRQRMMHKFNYFQENYSVTGCVGCGRCIMNCPVNLDIRKIIEEIGGIGVDVGVRA